MKPINLTLLSPVYREVNQKQSKEDPEIEAVVMDFLQACGLHYHYKTNSFVSSEGYINQEKLVLSKLRVYLLENGRKELKSYVADALRIHKEQLSQRYLAEMCRNFKYSGNSTNDLKIFTKALTGGEDLITQAVLRHFIWQVKRKLHSLPVEHHLLVCVYGPSGAGKSVAIHKLLAPLSDLKLDSDFSIFNDKFCLGIWERYFAVFCDEMGGIKSTSIERLKNIITAPRVESRGMRSEEIKSVKQNSTLIAASNVELKELINDPTSARRYFQIDCQPKIDWDVINDIDYLELWRSVDELGPCPLLPVLQDLRVIQELKIRSRCLVEQFIEEWCHKSEFHAASPTTQELYSSFVQFCRDQGLNSFEGLQQFSRRLPSLAKDLRQDLTPKRTFRGTVWPIRIG